MAIHIKILFIKAKLKVRLFLLPLSLIHLVNCASFAQSAESTAFGHYLNLRFDSCQALLPEIHNREYAFYLSSLIQTSEIFLSDNADLYLTKKYQEDETLRNLEILNFSDVYSNFLKSEVKIQWAILKMKYGDEFAAFWNMKQAYNISSENITTHPDFLPSYKSMGLLYILFGIVPEKFHWILSIFGIEGDVENGLKSLLKAQNCSSNYSLETSTMIALLNSYLLNKPDLGFSQISAIRGQNEYVMIDYAYALIAMKNSRSENALAVLQQVENTHSTPLALPQLYYLLGEIYLQKGEISHSIKYFQKYIDNQKGMSLLKDSYFKIGICHWINGDESLAKQSFALALNNGWTKNEADMYAQNQVESGRLSDKALYRLRFATDGGFYENAKLLQSEIEIEHLDGQDLCEYYYRTGRLMQKLGEKQIAIINYEKTIEIQGENQWYFAPNTALHLGFMHLNQNNPDAAKKYFERVFDYKNHPYEKSIRQKARAALKSID